ncbi:PREDICTED: translation initiation factor IF-2-like [Chinchilla lanigera]|uniref:translation initiation factor IF-2-like n=1 Tax=Chinchilla lanigera TaxID=34839 RepID=UPI000696E306|nr:PREDICTED: translation initiation factor IF-2-like [Chinchilla lanigera]
MSYALEPPVRGRLRPWDSEAFLAPGTPVSRGRHGSDTEQGTVAEFGVWEAEAGTGPRAQVAVPLALAQPLGSPSAGHSTQPCREQPGRQRGIRSSGSSQCGAKARAQAEEQRRGLREAQPSPPAPVPHRPTEAGEAAVPRAAVLHTAPGGCTQSHGASALWAWAAALCSALLWAGRRARGGRTTPDPLIPGSSPVGRDSRPTCLPHLVSSPDGISAGKTPRQGFGSLRTRPRAGAAGGDRWCCLCVCQLRRPSPSQTSPSPAEAPGLETHRLPLPALTLPCFSRGWDSDPRAPPHALWGSRPACSVAGAETQSRLPSAHSPSSAGRAPRPRSPPRLAAGGGRGRFISPAGSPEEPRKELGFYVHCSPEGDGSQACRLDCSCTPRPTPPAPSRCLPRAGITVSRRSVATRGLALRSACTDSSGSESRALLRRLLVPGPAPGAGRELRVFPAAAHRLFFNG